jgi:hypothetical protein
MLPLTQLPPHNEPWLQSQIYVRTDGQLASMSLGQAPFWGARSGFYYCQTVAGLLMWGALSHERTGLVLASAVILGSEFRRSHYHILLSQTRDCSNLQAQVPVFTSPRNRGGTGPPFRGSGGRGGIIHSRLYAGNSVTSGSSSLYSPGTDTIENTAPKKTC